MSSGYKAITLLHVGKLVTADRQCLCLIHALSPREALIRVSLPLTIGQSVTMGLRNGMTVPGVVAIIHGGQVSLLFEEQIPISRMLAEHQRGGGSEESVRLTVTTPASIVVGEDSYRCMLQDISLLGLKIRDGGAKLSQGMQVQIEIEGLGKRDAEVRWREDPYTGLRFDVPLGFKMLDQWAIQKNI